ncbi:MAG: hypothetical protein FWF56_03360 [Firmicutes bacterium]|nr:hypothetical protein [Bacillota bacterium]MCL1953704.1 hypothetical protein [Bacillota bacterium]
MKKTIIKTSIIILLICVLTVTSIYQLLPFVKSGFGDKFMSNDANDISIASNMQGATSREQQLQDISSLVAKNSGEMKIFKSEEEYLKVMNASNRVDAVVQENNQQEPIETSINQRIIVLDYLTSQPLQNVAVWIDDMPRFTNRDGIVSTTIDKERVYLLVEQDDYIPYMEYMEVNNSDKVIYLKRPSDDLNISAVWLSYNDDVANLLTQDYGIDMDDNDVDNARIEIKANVDADEYHIFQDNNLILSNSTGIFENIKLKELFFVGGNITVQILYSGIESRIFRTTLEFVDSYNLNVLQVLTENQVKDSESNVDLGGDMGGFGIPSILFLFDIMSKFNNLGNDDIQITSIYNNYEKTYTLLIGYQLWSKDTNKHDKGNSIKQAGEAIKIIKQKGYGWEKRLSDFFNSDPNYKPWKSGKNFTTVFNKKLEITFGVVGNLTFSAKDNWKIIDANIGLNVEATLRLSWNMIFFVVVPIPVYFYIEGKLSISLNYDFLKKIIELVIEISVTAGAGLGLDGIAGVGLKISVGLEMSWNSLPDMSQWKGEGKFQIGFEFFLLMFTQELILYQLDGTLWDTHDDPSKETLDSTITPMKIMGQSNQPYEDARPQLIQVGDKYIATYLESGKASNGVSPTRLMYKVYDNGTWSQPQEVVNPTTQNRVLKENQYFDLYPSMQVVNNKAYVTWQRIPQGDVNKLITKTQKTGITRDDINSIASKAEIFISEFDTDKNSFNTPQQITNNDVWDTLPKLTSDNQGNVVATWIQNSNNDIFGTTGTSSIQYSTLKNSTWSTPTTVYQTTKPILDYNTIWDNGLVVVANINNSTDLANTTDRQIVLIKGKTTTQITDSESYSGSAQFVNYQGKTLLFYSDEGKISYIDIANPTNQKVDIIEFEGDFTVINNNGDLTILYLGGADTQQVNKMVYDSDTRQWTQGLQVTTSDYSVRQFSAITTANGDTAILTHGLQKDDNNNITVSQIDFVIDDSITKKYDLALDSVSVFDSLNDNQDSILYMTISNQGEYSFDSIKVYINGLQIIQDLDEPLLPNELRVLQVPFKYTQASTLDIYAEINGKTEYDYTNNNYSIDTNFTKFEIDYRDYVNDDKLYFDIANLSMINSNIKFRVTNKDEEVIFETQSYSVSALSSITVEIQKEYDKWEIDGYDILKFEIISDTAQLYQAYVTMLITNTPPPPIKDNPYKDMLDLAESLSMF